MWLNVSDLAGAFSKQGAQGNQTCNYVLGKTQPNTPCERYFYSYCCVIGNKKIILKFHNWIRNWFLKKLNNLLTSNCNQTEFKKISFWSYQGTFLKLYGGFQPYDFHLKEPTSWEVDRSLWCHSWHFATFLSLAPFFSWNLLSCLRGSVAGGRHSMTSGTESLLTPPHQCASLPS